MKEEKQVGYRDIFHQVEYMKMMIAALINRFGDSIDAIASTWIVYEITNNAAWSALIFGINKVPSILITPLAGAWVEGRKKKNIMIVTDIIRAICVAFIATGYLMGFLQAWMLVITTLIISTVEAFRGPANMALTPKVLKREYYEYGMSLSSTLSSSIEMIGTAVAAGIIAMIGTVGAIYLDMLTFVISALIIAFVNTKEQNLLIKKFNGKQYLKDLSDGFIYVKKEKKILFLLLLCVFMNAVLTPINSLQAPLASEVLGGGAEILSLLGTTVMLGMLLGSLTYPMLAKIVSGKKILIIGNLGMSLFYISLPAFSSLYTNKIFMYIFSSVLGGVLGYTAALTSSYMNVFSIKRIKEEYLARTSSISTAVSIATVPIASFILSGLVSYVSTAHIFIYTGVLALLVTICMLFSKTLAGNGEKSVSDNVDELQSTEAV